MFFDKKTGNSILSFLGVVHAKKGDIIYLKREDHRNESRMSPEFDEIHQRKWKVVSVSRSVEETISDNTERTENNPFMFKIRVDQRIDISVKPKKDFRAWIRPKIMRKKNGFWLDTSRLNEHGIIEFLWFGFSWR